MNRGKDITGDVYGKLTAIRSTGRKNNNGCYIWEFSCECGNLLEREIGNLRSRRDSAKCSECTAKQTGDRVRTHGTPKNDKVYKAWCKIKERCLNPRDKSYPNYGAIGITMQEDWINDFVKFRDHIGQPPKDGKRYSVDRIENSIGYQEGNVRWATDVQQARNKGLQRNNKTGTSGVQWDDKYWRTKDGTQQVNRYAKATWYDDIKQRNKCFSIKTYGEELAHFMACEYREQMINLLNLQGAGYTEGHGKPKVVAQKETNNV